MTEERFEPKPPNTLTTVALYDYMYGRWITACSFYHLGSNLGKDGSAWTTFLSPTPHHSCSPARQQRWLNKYKNKAYRMKGSEACLKGSDSESFC